MKTHSQKMPLNCNMCSYSTARKSDLMRHMQTHTGDKPFKCDICPYFSCKEAKSSTSYEDSHRREAIQM